MPRWLMPSVVRISARRPRGRSARVFSDGHRELRLLRTVDTADAPEHREHERERAELDAIEPLGVPRPRARADRIDKREGDGARGRQDRLAGRRGLTSLRLPTGEGRDRPAQKRTDQRRLARAIGPRARRIRRPSPFGNCGSAGRESSRTVATGATRATPARRSRARPPRHMEHVSAGGRRHRGPDRARSPRRAPAHRESLCTGDVRGLAGMERSGLERLAGPAAEVSVEERRRRGRT